MKQNYLFKTLFLLCALLVGSVNSVWADNYKLYTGAITEGDYLVVYDAGAMKATVSSGRLDFSDVVVSGEIIANTDKALVWHIAASGNYFTLQNVNGYAAGTGAKNKAQLLADATDDKALWEVEVGEGVFEFVNKANKAANVNCNLRRNGTYGFACYSTSTGGALSLYKKEEASSDKQTPVLSFPEESYTADINDGFTAPVLTNESGVDVVYKSSNFDVASVDPATGEVTLAKIGTTVISASFNGNDTYNAAVAQYTLIVTNRNGNDGSLEKPYTVDEARAAIDAGEGVEGVYAKGIVSKIVTAYSSQYGNISYNISEDGTETANQLQAYRGKSYEGANFTSEDDIKVGDVVVIYGNLKKFSSTYEFDANNQLVSLTRPGEPVDERLDVVMSYPEASYEVTLGEDFTAPVLTITEGYDGTVAYISSDETVATVAADGAVTILAAGTTTITATAPATDNYKSATASYKLTVNAGEEPTPELSDDLFSLVTDVTVLKANDKILFVNSEASVALSTEQKSNNRGQAEVTITESNQIEGVSANVQVITLEGESGAWYFKVGDGYLYAASSKSNYLRTEAEKDDNAKATIAIDETNATITFQGENTRNVLMYNASSSLFSCYASTSTQAPVQLYVKTGTTGIQTVNHTNVADGAYFNLAGQRVAAPAKGLYIVNGKKVVLK